MMLLFFPGCSQIDFGLNSKHQYDLGMRENNQLWLSCSQTVSSNVYIVSLCSFSWRIHQRPHSCVYTAQNTTELSVTVIKSLTLMIHSSNPRDCVCSIHSGFHQNTSKQWVEGCVLRPLDNQFIIPFTVNHTGDSLLWRAQVTCSRRPHEVKVWMCWPAGPWRFILGERWCKSRNDSAANKTSLSWCRGLPYQTFGVFVSIWLLILKM